MSPSPEGPAAEASDPTIVSDELLTRLGHLLAHEAVELQDLEVVIRLKIKQVSANS